jgi:hypothetical protein
MVTLKSKKGSYIVISKNNGAIQVLQKNHGN